MQTVSFYIVYTTIMYIAILGRQPALGMAELERHFGSDATSWLSSGAAKINTDSFNIALFGGIQKAGRIIAEYPSHDWTSVSKKLIRHYSEAWTGVDHKITLGISAYDCSYKTRDLQWLGLELKKSVKRHGGSLRLIPNADPALNTATSHHNKLGLSPHKIELLLVKTARGSVIVAESVGAQNITAIAARDQARPKTDAFVGMLPPKLALMMVNMAAGSATPAGARILDPFCGTGVVLQEASLRGFEAYGTDLSDKMIDYSRANLAWLRDKYQLTTSVTIEQGDAMNHRWQPPIDAIASETYLGQPFSAPPAAEKLAQVRDNCNHIISTFLTNLADQIEPGTVLCLAVPAWRDGLGRFTHLPLIDSLDRLGYRRLSLSHVRDDQLLYYRDNQVVARELLLLTK